MGSVYRDFTQEGAPSLTPSSCTWTVMTAGSVETELKKLEKIVPGLVGEDEREMEEILELTVAYIAELQNHLVGRVRTHGERTFRKLNKNLRVGANLSEKSSKEDIIKFLHKISTK